MLWNVKAMN